jgi:hypothetical protein
MREATPPLFGIRTRHDLQAFHDVTAPGLQRLFAGSGYGARDYGERTLATYYARPDDFAVGSRVYAAKLEVYSLTGSNLAGDSGSGRTAPRVDELRRVLAGNAWAAFDIRSDWHGAYVGARLVVGGQKLCA